VAGDCGNGANRQTGKAGFQQVLFQPPAKRPPDPTGGDRNDDGREAGKRRSDGKTSKAGERKSEKNHHKSIAAHETLLGKADAEQASQDELQAKQIRDREPPPGSKNGPPDPNRQQQRACQALRDKGLPRVGAYRGENRAGQ
jgi:hypothetical protein